jgi:hypothetical protein
VEIKVEVIRQPAFKDLFNEIKEEISSVNLDQKEKQPA